MQVADCPVGEKMAKNNLFIAVAAVAVVAIVCVAAYVVLSNDKDDRETYWFYVDYGVETSNTAQSGWLSGHGDTVSDGLHDAFGDNIELSPTGMTNTIFGVDPDWENGYGWGSWYWAADTYDATITDGWTSTPKTVVNMETGNVFYIAVTKWIQSGDEWSQILNPGNTTADWKSGGPFA